MSTTLEVARQVIFDESAALRAVAEMLDHRFDEALELVQRARHVVVTGLGKSGSIAQKIAGSLTSTGTPAVFMHPVEALHGDLGIVRENDVLIALSRSGNTDEVVRFAAHFRRLGGPVIGLTQGPGSKLAELATQILLLPDLPEAGPLNLAPTTSCIMQLAIGDALAMALLHRRGFKDEDFAQYHPEGTLGRRLLLRVCDLMHTGQDLPRVRGNDSCKQLLVEMTRKPLGVALIETPDGRLLGTFTDGDLRRLLERVPNVFELDAAAAYSRSRRAPDQPPVPVSTVSPDHLAVDCLRIMRDSQITCLVVLDSEGRPVGLLRLLELLRAGIA